MGTGRGERGGVLGCGVAGCGLTLLNSLLTRSRQGKGWAGGGLVVLHSVIVLVELLAFAVGFDDYIAIWGRDGGASCRVDALRWDCSRSNCQASAVRVCNFFFFFQSIE